MAVGALLHWPPLPPVLAAMTARRIRAGLAALLAAISLMSGAGVASTFPPLAPDTAVEFYHAAFDHYFITNNPAEIDALDSGRTVGWTRTGRGFRVYPVAPPGAGASPVCRFYIPPQHGDSHFFSASLAECQDVLGRIGVDPKYSGYVYESPNVFYVALPDTTTGACAAGSVPVYRLWNQRADSNHRYTTDAGIKAAMQAKGYLAEGYGPAAASLCSTAAVLVDAVTRASGLSPFAPGCEGVPTTGFAYTGAEVEPSIAVNPTNPNNLIGAWQQDRWSNGGARGLGSAYSLDGGGTWTRTSVPFSRCSGGNAANGGDYERATDPWVTFAPDGTAYQIALAFNSQRNGDNAILVARSTDGGRTWGNPVTLKRDGAANFNDKEAITADPTDARYVYAVWDRLTGNNGPTWFARTVNGGATWEPARNLYDPDPNSQTINNQVVVLPDGTLVLFFTELANVGAPNMRLRILRSSGQGRDVVGADHDRDRPDRRDRRPRHRHGHPRRLDPGLDRGRQGRHAGGRVAGLALLRQPRRHRIQPVDGRRPYMDRDGLHELRHAGARIAARGRHPRRRRHRRRVLQPCREHARPGHAADPLHARDVERRRDVDHAAARGTLRLRNRSAGGRPVFHRRLHGHDDDRHVVRAVLRPDHRQSEQPLGHHRGARARGGGRGRAAARGCAGEGDDGHGADDRRTRATRGGERAPRAGGAAARGSCRN